MRRRQAILFAASASLLATQAVATHRLRRSEYRPHPPLLADFPGAVGPWRATEEYPMEPSVAQMLSPDDFLHRRYTTGDAAADVTLFIAYYGSQMREKLAHDPKVCLPGAGWVPTANRVVTLPVAGKSDGLDVNDYVIRRGDVSAVVLYWFETYAQSYAREQGLRLGKLFDTLRLNRSDMALIRVIAPVAANGPEPARQRAQDFTGRIYSAVRRQFPDAS